MFEYITFICYLGTNNQEVILAMNKTISDGLKNLQSKSFLQFFIQKLISVQD